MLYVQRCRTGWELGHLVEGDFTKVIQEGVMNGGKKSGGHGGAVREGCRTNVFGGHWFDKMSHHQRQRIVMWGFGFGWMGLSVFGWSWSLVHGQVERVDWWTRSIFTLVFFWHLLPHLTFCYALKLKWFRFPPSGTGWYDLILILYFCFSVFDLMEENTTCSFSCIQIYSDLPVGHFQSCHVDSVAISLLRRAYLDLLDKDMFLQDQLDMCSMLIGLRLACWRVSIIQGEKNLKNRISFQQKFKENILFYIRCF